MTDPIALLRESDPAARLPDAPLPEAVLEQILATPPPRARTPRRLVVAAVAGALAVAAVLGVVIPGEGTDLAARAYAATAPGEAVLYTEVYTEQDMPGVTHERNLMRIWQRGDQSRRLVTQPRGGARVWVYDYVADGGVLRARLPGGEIQTVRESDGWEARNILATERTSFVDSFRARYADAELRDAGPATFDGRPAHAYEARGPRRHRETYYLDPESGMPLGSVTTFPLYDPERPERRTGEARFTQILRKFERLPATPENLARLTAPWADRPR
jgi:hypothetical protein